MNYSFDHPKRRLERAYNRIAELGDLIDEYWKSEPYGYVRERTPDGRSDVHSVRIQRGIPLVCEDVAAEALLALRSCLDQAGYAAAVASGKNKPKATYFPITKGTAATLDEVIKNNCKDLPGEIKTLFRGYNAHKGGNAILCTLNEMRNAVHTAFAPHIITPIHRKLRIPSTKHSWEAFDPVVWNEEKSEFIYLRTPVGADVPHSIDFTFSISFSDVEGIEHVPAVDVLSTMATEVRGILNSTEDECRRLGFIA